MGGSCETNEQPTTSEHFDVFTAACRKYLSLFGLSEWKVYFGHELIEGVYADSIVNSQDAVATLRLSTVWHNRYRPRTDDELDKDARHEVLHVLLGALVGAANSRWVASEGMLDRVIERTVHLIEHALDAVEAR